MSFLSSGILNLKNSKPFIKWNSRINIRSFCLHIFSTMYLPMKMISHYFDMTKHEWTCKVKKVVILLCIHIKYIYVLAHPRHVVIFFWKCDCRVHVMLYPSDVFISVFLSISHQVRDNAYCIFDVYNWVLNYAVSVCSRG